MHFFISKRHKMEHLTKMRAPKKHGKAAMWQKDEEKAAKYSQTAKKWGKFSLDSFCLYTGFLRELCYNEF